MGNHIPGDDKERDATIVRPQTPPGSTSPAAPPPPSAPPPSSPPPSQPPPVAYAHAAPSAAISEFLDGGLNPLVQVASPLLLLAVQLRSAVTQPDAGQLRERVVAQVRNFETQAQARGIASQTVTVARYALCAMIDESVLNTPWGEHSGWSAKTLLMIFHRESYGGEKFFLILDRLKNDFSRHVDLIEMMYLCLALGFSGRYQVEAGGQARLADIQEDLYRRLKAQRAAPAAELAPHWKGEEDRRSRLIRFVPIWVIAVAGACLLLGAFLYFNARLNDRSSPVSAQLARIGFDGATLPASPTAPPAPVVARKTLKELLTKEEKAGLVTVIEQGHGKELARINAATMFASGGTDVRPAQARLLHTIGKALVELKGRVIVVGHTDNVPVHSLKFKDNYALSLARARSVVKILAQEMKNPERMEAVGAGSSQPIALPPSLPANRARNRRVEITYIPEG